VDELIKEYQRITQKLLSKLEFQKNMWVTLLIFLYIGRFVHIEFLACSRKTFYNSKTRNLPAIFFTLWEWRWGISSQHCDDRWNVGVSLQIWNQVSVCGVTI